MPGDGEQQHLNLPLDKLSGATEYTLPFSAAKVVDRVGSTTRLIIESVDIPPGMSISQLRDDVKKLAWRLQQVDPDTFGILRCRGLLKYPDPQTGSLAAIDVVYRAPAERMLPTSLRQLLVMQKPVSASAIMRLAKQLVRSVCYVHTCDFVHKNIRPENILVFSSEASLFASSYLLGFTQFRSAHFQTNLSGDPSWHRNLYRHPQRQGAFVQERYIMQHDIYSLGVCLLEIGLWQSLVWFPISYDNAVPGPLLGTAGQSLCDQDFMVTNPVTPFWIKDSLVALAGKELPLRLGDVYTSIVLTCLTCLDPGNDAFGSEQSLTDEDGIAIGVRFVEKILSRITEIHI
jgi:hypothetical protein